MALETIKGLRSCGGFEINHMDKRVTPEEFEKIKTFININHDENVIAFKIQDRPIKEAGVNGCQVDTIIAIATEIIRGLNYNFRSHYNEIAIHALDTASMALMARTRDREKRGVEGTSQE